MLPTLFLSTSGTIMVPFISRFEWSAGTITTIYAIITLLIGLVNYFRLESSYQQFSILADRYDKLQTSLELANNKLVFIENRAELEHSVSMNIREFEHKLSDIVNVIVPEDVKRLFPVICNINIFSFIRKIEAQKRALIIQYKDVYNSIDLEFTREIRAAEYKIKKWFFILLFGLRIQPINNPIIQKYLA